MKLLTQGGWTKEQKKGLKILCKMSYDECREAGKKFNNLTSRSYTSLGNYLKFYQWLANGGDLK